MEGKKKMAGWLVLTIIVAVAAIALAVTNLVTEGPINDRNWQQAQGALQGFFPEGDDFQPMTLAEDSGLDFAYTVGQGGQTVGYAAKTTTQGYAGPIEITFGLGTDGALKGISVGGSEFKETEGLGAKAKEPAFTDQFAGQTPPLELNDDIDALSGATVTSKAVVHGVNAAAERLAQLTGVSAAPTPAAGPQAARTANASVMSYSGPVLVNLVLDEQGAITAMEIGRERFMESPDYGAKVKEDGFVRQFIGQTPPLQLGGDIDAVSGATGSSQAVVDAVNAAWEFTQGE